MYLAYEYLGRTDLVHVLDKPEVLNTGTDDWDEVPTSLEYEKKTPELSDVRVVAKPAANGAHPVKPQKATAAKMENRTGCSECSGKKYAK